MASKKTFALIANALIASRPLTSKTVERAQWLRTCESIASALAETNPRFDRFRFLAACGVETVATEAHAIRKEGTIRERLLGNEHENQD